MKHTICDSLGLVQFLTMVGEIARGAPISPFPVWQRELFNARDAPRITYAHHEYDEIKHFNNKQSRDFDQMAHESFFFGPKEIATLRNHLPPKERELFYNVDFGWGSPSYGGPAGAIPFVSFYGRFRDSEGEDWVVVPILLPHHVMKKFLFELVKITVRSL
ncbi:Benzyl alcohol O-benzoyltransferase [Glycine max]|nr:Benzyl alcohol O-benzoyltransferase [Glycine max]